MNEQSQPVAYGYMRAGGQVTDDQIEQARTAVATYAEKHGFALETLYIEDDTTMPHRQFNALIDVLRAKPANAVIFPTVLDLGGSPATRLWIENTLRGQKTQLSG